MGQRRCADSVAEKGAKRMNTLFNQPLKVVNAGLHSFADNIQHAGGSAIALNWQPPAQGDIDAGLDLASLLRHPGRKCQPNRHDTLSRSTARAGGCHAR